MKQDFYDKLKKYGHLPTINLDEKFKKAEKMREVE